jgi:two-component system, LytTR family, sensor histidine kinase AlgZ
MKEETQILSAFQDLTLPERQEQVRGVLVFDACSMGVILRAVLFVEAAIGVVAAFAANSLWGWVLHVSLVTGAALPATLVWLLAACISKKVLAKWVPWAQYGAATVMGALSGLYGASLLTFAALLETTPWIASALSGAALSAMLVAGLVMRAKGRTPADTAARLTELQSRIRPHFLFNTLNSAIALVRAEPAKAETLLEDLSDLFRHALIDQGPSVTLADEIMLAQRYLAIEQVRFGDRLKVEWDLDPQAEVALLPPLILQPLVENAVRHGVEPSAAGAMVKIRTQRRGSSVVIKVANTVPAGQGEAGHGVALRNVRDRLGLLHDVQGQFKAGLKDGVYQVRMEVPV